MDQTLINWLMGGFDRRVWNRKALLDWLLPVIASFTLAYLLP